MTSPSTQSRENLRTVRFPLRIGSKLQGNDEMEGMSCNRKVLADNPVLHFLRLPDVLE